MCGHAVMPSNSTIKVADMFGVDLQNGGGYKLEDVTTDAHPGDSIMGVVESEHGKRFLSAFHWGVSNATMRLQGGKGVYNARLETASTIPMWQESWGHRRAIVPMAGFYERAGRAEYKVVPVHEDGENLEIFPAAALWQHSPNGSLDIAVITMTATGHLRDIHHRAPVMVPNYLQDEWLDRSVVPDSATSEHWRDKFFDHAIGSSELYDISA